MRSPVSSRAPEPASAAMRSPGRGALPSGRSIAIGDAGSSRRKASDASLEARHAPGARHHAGPPAGRRDDRVGREVAGAAEILGERAAHDVLVEQRQG